MNFLEQVNKGNTKWWAYVLTIVVVLMSLIIGSGVAGVGMQIVRSQGVRNSTLDFIFLMIPFAFVLFGLMIAVKTIHRRKARTIFTAREKFDWKRYLFAFGVHAIVLMISMVIAGFFGQDLYWIGKWETFFPLLIAALVMVPLQTAAEDAFFRGYLFQSFGKAFQHGGLSVLVTGVMFGMMHISNPEIELIGYKVLVYFIWSGLFLGIIAQMDDGLELGMGYHAVNNLFGAVVVTNTWQVFQTDALLMDASEPTFSWDNLLALFIIQPVLTIIFAKVYKWKSWKTRLFSRTKV